MEIRWLETESETLWFRIDGLEVKVDSDDGNIIEGVFPGLTALYFRHSIKLSIQYCIGQLVGDDENPHKSLGTVIPLSSLESICRNSLTIKAVLAFLQVCKCMHSNLRVTINSSHSSSSIGNIENIEMPASAIWSLLMLSELLGVHKLHEDCICKLGNMFKRDDEPKLPTSVTAVLLASDLPIIETNLQQCFNQRSMQADVVTNAAYVSTATASIPVSIEPATVFARHTDDMYKPGMQNNNQRYAASHTLTLDTQYEPSGQRFDYNDTRPNSSAGELGASYQGHYAADVSNHSSREYLAPPPVPTPSLPARAPVPANPHEDYHNYQLRSSSTTPVVTPHTSQHENQYRSEQRTSTPQRAPNASAAPTSSQSKYTSPSTDYDNGEDSTEDSFGEVDRYHHQRHDHAKNGNSRATSPAQRQLKRHSALNNSQETPARPTSPGFGSATRRFTTPFAEPVVTPRSGVVITPTTYKERSGNAGKTRPGSSEGKAALSSQSTGSSHSGHSGLSLSPQTDFEYDSDPGAHPVRAALTAEDLRISREIAKLRLQEVKVKEELEASKQRAEREMRETRLRSLELKAAVARTAGHSAALRSSQTQVQLTQNTKYNAESSKMASRDEPSARVAAANQRFIAEEARIRAASRVRDARKAQARKEAQQQAELRYKDEQKWALRDKKIELFKEKQRMTFGEAPQCEEDTSEGVSVQWLRGTVPAVSAPPPPPRTPRAVQNLRTSVSASKDRYSVNNMCDVDPPSTDDELQAHNTIVKSGLYSTEALEAVGMGLSPGSSNLVPKSSFSAPTSPAGVGAAAVDLLSVKIIRAWGLSESLGGTNPYVVVDWGKYGKSATQAVAHTTEPHFGATLQFRSPYTVLRDTDRQALQNDPTIAVLHASSGTQYISFAGPLKVSVYNRNQSVSDELLAYGEVDAHEYLTCGTGETSVLHLIDASSRPAGCLEYSIRHSKQ